MGHVINVKGPSRSSAIKNMPAPPHTHTHTNVSPPQAFIGLAKYDSNFNPNMHILRAHLNKLLKKDSKWNWSTEYQSAFEEIKK